MISNDRQVKGLMTSKETECRLLTIPAAASYLSATTWAIRCLIWEGALPYVRLGRRHLVDRADLDALVDRHKLQEGARTSTAARQAAKNAVF